MGDVSIATISWARNDEEEKVLRSSLDQLASLGLPVCITDGGSSESFLQFLHGYPNFKGSQKNGLWPQAKNSIAMASRDGSKFILYTEPDKKEFFSNHLSKLIRESVDKKTGVVLASRSPEALSTFPPFQQMTETTINRCCKQVIGSDIDYCYGPFMFDSQLVPFLNSLDDNCGWGWRPFLFAIAHRLGYEIRSFVGDFKCPSDQGKDNEAERIYRMKQLAQNINGLVQAATMDVSKIQSLKAVP